jgi:hypothetical protein
MSVPYPPKDCRITFTEQSFRSEFYRGRQWIYTKAIIENNALPLSMMFMPEQEIRMDKLQQVVFMTNLLNKDGTIFNAVIGCKHGIFWLIAHSPQRKLF